LPDHLSKRRLEPRLARLVESGLCTAKNTKRYQRDLTALVERTSGDKDLELQAGFFKALSDETRLKIVYALLAREMCECEIMAALGLTQSTASHHLRILQRSGAILRKKHGKWAFYRVDGSHMQELLVLRASANPV
jgi:DNA-binding transcriptional ArsR family regulator